MKKKYFIIILCIVLTLGIIGLFIYYGGINYLFSSQYNENGISHFLVVTKDDNQSKEFIGELDGHRIYIEKLNIDKTNFRNVDAKNVSIKKAIEEKLVSIAEWRKYAWKIQKDGDAEILKYDNYEISCAYDDCIIRPLNYNSNNSDEVKETLKIFINDNEYIINLEDNDTVKDFINLLPIKLNMKELNGNEKYVYLDTTLNSNPVMVKHINKGDVMLYGNNCLVIFYKSFDTSYSYTSIGHIDNLPDFSDENISVMIEK